MKQFKQTNPWWLALLLLIVVGVGCQHDEVTPIEAPQTQRLLVSAQDVPTVTHTLLEKLGVKDAQSKFSVNDGEASSPFSINWDRIKQLVDSTGRQTYTFGITVDDGNPATFYNLILRYNENEEAHRPFILKYTMDDDFLEEYYQTASIRNFRGKVQKIIIDETGTTSNRRGSAALGNDGSGTDPAPLGTPCPDETSVGSPSGDPTDADGQGAAGCRTYLVTDYWYTTVCNAGGCETTRTIEGVSLQTICSGSDGYSAAGADSNCDPDEGEIPILDPFAAKKDSEKEIESITDPEERRKAQLEYLKRFGGSEGKAVAKMIEEMLSTSDLTFGDVLEINKMVEQFYLNLKGQYLMTIFSVDNVSTIISLGIGGNLTNNARNSFYKAVARYAGSTGKGYSSFSAFKAAQGLAGRGQAWHHIVSQRAANITKFGVNKIHNTNNLVKLPHGAASWHQRITNFYNTIGPRGINTQGLRFGEWLSGKSFQEQYEWGIKIMQWLK